jgi:hypothetical protein
MNRWLWIFLAFSTLWTLWAEPRLEVDVWTGYNFPLNDSIRNQCTTYPATGNYCRTGGVSFGTGLFISAIGSLRTGVGFAYLPISDGRLKVSDSILVNIGSSYAPAMLQLRYDFGFFHVQLGTGYALTVERPGVPGSQPASTADSGAYATSAQIGFRAAISDNAAFYAAFTHYVLFPPSSGGVIHNLVPMIGMRANLGH